jgi:hypothetical protein
MCLQNASTGQHRSRSLNLATFFIATALTRKLPGDVPVSMMPQSVAVVEEAL